MVGVDGLTVHAQKIGGGTESPTGLLAQNIPYAATYLRSVRYRRLVLVGRNEKTLWHITYRIHKQGAPCMPSLRGRAPSSKLR